MAKNNMDITAANAVSVLTVQDLFPAGINLLGYSTDQSISQEAVQIAETRMGVDGYMVAGYVPGIQVVNIMLEASSPSTESFNQIYDAMVSKRTIFLCELICTVPSIGAVFTWKRGVLQTGTAFPANKKVLDPTSWIFNFEALERSSV
jgi:hypothetical protein